MELLPGVEFACEAVYSLTQADVDAAEVMNTVTVSGVARDVDSTEVLVQQRQHISGNTIHLFRGRPSREWMSFNRLQLEMMDH